MTTFTSVTRQRIAGLALICAAALVASACSTASDQADGTTSAPPTAPAQSDTGSTAATTASTAPQGTSADATSGDLDCEEFERLAGVVRGALPLMANTSDAATMDAFGIDLDKLDEAIEGLRPIQDMESALGNPREALDAVATDVQAFREGRFDDRVSSVTSIVPITDVIAQQVCAS